MLSRLAWLLVVVVVLGELQLATKAAGRTPRGTSALPAYQSVMTPFQLFPSPVALYNHNIRALQKL